MLILTDHHNRPWQVAHASALLAGPDYTDNLLQIDREVTLDVHGIEWQQAEVEGRVVCVEVTQAPMGLIVTLAVEADYEWDASTGVGNHPGHGAVRFSDYLEVPIDLDTIVLIGPKMKAGR